MEFHMLNVMYAALPMCAQTEKATFSCKDDYCKAQLGDALTTAPMGPFFFSIFGLQKKCVTNQQKHDGIV